MINSIDIEGFRGIRSTETPIELSEFTILLGRNNSGKTTVLEALYSVFSRGDPFLGDTSDRLSRSRVIRRLHDDRSLSYRYSGDGEITIVKGSEKHVQNVAGTVKPSKDIGQLEDAIYYPPSFKSLELMYSRLQDMRTRIEKDGTHITVAELVNRCVSDEYTEIYLETLEMRKKPPDGDQFYISIKDLGDGVLRAIPAYLMVETADPELFLWDDIDTSLHPGLTRELLQWLVQKDTQFVGATHSIDVLSTLIDIQPDADVSVIQLNKSSDDVLRHQQLDLEELELMMENAGHDPRFMTSKLEL